MRLVSWSLPVRGAWIEIARKQAIGYRLMSLPVRGAWIEMWSTAYKSMQEYVAPRAGSVD